MRLALDDGDTLDWKTDDAVVDPISPWVLAINGCAVSFRYRPALPDALAEYRATHSGKRRAAVPEGRRWRPSPITSSVGT